MSENPLRVGTVSTVPLTDMRKFTPRGDQVDPPSLEARDRKLGAGFTSVVGDAALQFHASVALLLPLSTTKNCEFGASEIGELGV